jgi:hypothetical protein
MYGHPDNLFGMAIIQWSIEKKTMENDDSGISGKNVILLVD